MKIEFLMIHELYNIFSFRTKMRKTKTKPLIFNLSINITINERIYYKMVLILNIIRFLRQHWLFKKKRKINHFKTLLKQLKDIFKKQINQNKLVVRVSYVVTEIILKNNHYFINTINSLKMYACCC